MRALLVVNPQATSTTPAGRDVLAHALASELKLDVLLTRYRGHAAEATAQAVADGVELVVALGGDGTVNEVVNGLLVAGDGRVPDDPWEAPALAVVPGGSANVFARALGMPRDPLEATAAVLAALEAGRSRLVGLGRADDRWFTFNAGLGWDADVVAAVERARTHGREATPLRYAGTAVGQYLRQRRNPPAMTVMIPDAAPITDVRLALVSNTDPWTYLSGRAVRTNPGASFTAGLALFALRDLGLPTIAPVLRQLLRSDGNPRGRHVARQDAVAWVRIHTDEPRALQVDGDHLGERSEVEFVAVPEALRVVV
ncbi:diacylglycerol/lipid kinase family protein [Pseudonocardia asaccharolytica]|uniref:Diacylglycerol kinase n=1 Tax=Pseudonocardia asaccharolytica DSM 44247 = NBRC 16224 TaxID=1123024 RepID=A0A511D7I7_9PSEU|nr:diacylglycerol kinase family protein [Pseudonocardia asaccharolytica]GEL20760.1 diacylglycerol kinase [Pseudonocardia asaccharolytica DSM 44247 = NBRC 16224]